MDAAIETELEKWKSINGFEEKYEVSSLGEVRNIITGKLLKQKTKHSRGGYKEVTLIKAGDGKNRYVTVHRLVAENFIEGRTEEEDQVNHKDCDKENNRVTNLEWVSGIQNMRHARASGRMTGMTNPNRGFKLDVEKVKDIRRRRADGEIYRTMAEQYGVSIFVVMKICKNEIWREPEYYEERDVA